MVHNAFDEVAVVRDCPIKISSLVLWDRRLLLACIDGSLRLYAPENENGEGFGEQQEQQQLAPRYALRHTRVAFSKKPITCMHALRACLVSLSDALAIHTLPEFDLVTTLAKTKGASLYAWDAYRSQLAVAVKKRLHIYRLDGRHDVSEVKELGIPDVAKSMVWCGDSLCLGIRKEYVIVNVSTGASTEVFPAGRVAPPFAVALSRDQLLLGKENVGVFVDSNGKLTQQSGISWSEPPGTVVTHGPYALARMSRFIEVRSLRTPHGLVQTLPIREPQLLLSDGGGVVAASETVVYLLVTVPIAMQVVQLAASGNFEDALALCKLLPPEDAALRIAKEDGIHQRYGHTLFEKGEYVQAMEHFAASSLDLVTILSLFPSIKLPSWVSRPANVLSQGYGEELSLPFDQLDGAAGKLEDEEQHVEVKISTSAFNALSGFLTARRGAVIGKVQAEETTAAVAAIVEVSALKRGLSGERKFDDQSFGTDSQQKRGPKELAIVLDTALVQALVATGHSQAALELLKGPNYCDVPSCEKVMLAGGHYAEVIELYRHNHKHRAALELLNRLALEPESFDVQPSSSVTFGPQQVIDYILVLGDSDPSLVLETSTKLLRNEPDQALRLFTALKPPLPAKLVLSHLKEHAPQLRATYLETVLTEHPEFSSADLQNELVQLYLSRVLVERDDLLSQGKWDEREHSLTRQKLFTALETSSDYMPEIIFQQLPSDGLYHERAFLLGRMGQHKLALTLYAHKLHERELALAYCDRVYSSVSGRSSSRDALFASVRGQSSSDQDSVHVYLTLLEVYLRPEAAVKEFERSLWRVFPSKGTPNQKAGTVQKQRGNVGKKIAQIEGAEQGPSYSSGDNAVDSSRGDSDEGTSGEGQMLDEALRLLSERWDRLNCAQALRMIPSDTKLEQLLPFLEPLLRKVSEARRNLAVIKSLRRSEHIQVREELLNCRRRTVKTTTDRNCATCHKRMGNSAFAVYPSGVVVHFVCYTSQQAIKSGVPRASGP